MLVLEGYSLLEQIFLECKCVVLKIMSNWIKSTEHHLLECSTLRFRGHRTNRKETCNVRNRSENKGKNIQRSKKTSKEGG